MSTLKLSKAKNISLRLSDLQDQQVREMAKKIGVSQTKIIEWALSALSEYYTLHNGRCALPIDFSELWTLANKTKPSGHELNEEGNYRTRKKGSIDVRNAAAPLPTYLVMRKAHILEPLATAEKTEVVP
jgi:hypothetical protein